MRTQVMVVVLSCLLCACASIFKESEMVANDLGQLLNDRLPAAKRTNLVTSKDPSGQYWSLNANPAMSK